MSRVVLRCQNCRHSLLDSFVALAGFSIPAQSPRALRPQPWLAVPERRSYAKTFFLNQTNVQPAARSTDEPPDEARGPVPSASEPPTSTASDSIPWYLQVSTPTPPAPISPLLALQEIPPLPPNPPSLLEPLLEHLSVQIGLDNLSLIDLRHLHPPPALGANLLMIIGTARSVKHLNVSADRFCRWLRTEWRLRPYADGLLGRNELKLKLRRKARRQKMMGLVGAREVTTEDDGITTGWVCVNVGIVDEDLQPRPKPVEGETEQGGQETEAAITRRQEADASHEEHTNTETEEELEQHHESEEDYAGFGSRTTSPRIVVQMFTEEKRLEMDLEGLWDDRSTRRTRTGEKRDLRAAENLKMKGLVLEDTDDVVEKGMSEVWEPKSQSRNLRSEPQGRKDVKSRTKAVNVWGD